MTRWCRACLGTLLLTSATLCASAASPKRVLILDPFGRDVAPFSTAVSTFRTTLARDLGEPVDIYELPLELARFAEPEGEGPLVTFLEGRIKNQPVDLVVPIGTGGVRFAVRHHDRLFSNTPILVVGAPPRMVPPGLLRSNATLVTQKVNLSSMVEDILQVQPQTTNIVVVFGASALERFWVGECRREFQIFTNRVGFTWLNDLPLNQIVERCAALPPRSFILHGLFVVDAAGVPCEKNEALRRLHQAANAPLFGYYASEFGLGPIGGRLYQDAEVGVQGARTATRILRGERPGSIPPQVFEAAAPVFDWRELQRWGISEARLPAGSIIQFRQPGFWESYRWPIAGAVLFCVLQAALIIGLLINRAKRRQGEAAATLIADLSSKFVNLPAGEVDREIEDAQRRVCECLGLDLSALWQWADETPRYLRLTHLYRPLGGPPTPERFDAQEAFPWCLRQLLDGKVVPVSSMESLPPEAARDQEAWRHYGIKSNLTFPLSAGGGQLCGALSFNTMREERSWPEEIVKRLQLVAQIFANALARKRADQALRESEARLSLAADSAEVGLWELDCSTRVFWATEKVRAIFGYPPGEVISMERFEASVHPDDLGRVRQVIEQSLGGREPLSVEYRICPGDGRARWIASRGRPYFKSTGEPERLMGTSVDITERKRLAERLQSAAEEWKTTFDSINDLVMLLDPEYRIIRVNAATVRFLGLPMERIIGSLCCTLMHGTSCPIDGCPCQKTFQTKLRSELELFHAGSGKWLLLSTDPIQDAAGNVIAAVHVGRDITQHKQAEIEAQELRGNLTHLTRVNTLGALSGSLAHELNQPLGIILSNAQAAQELLLQEPPDVAEVQAILSDIVAADRRAGEVIERLRALLKHGQLSLQPLPLNQVIEEVLRLTNADLIGRGVTVVRELAPGLPPIAGDRVQLQQLVLNLILNGAEAVAANPPGARRLHLQTMLHQDRVRASVRDEGGGLPADVERLFQPFYTTKPQGLGMGLAICRSIVAAHNGRLWAEPHSERGAVFHVELPVVGSPDKP